MINVNDYDLISKNKLRRLRGWSEAFFDSLPLPKYPVGKRDYYRICDIEPTLERIKKEKQWASIKIKSPRIGSMTSQLPVSDIEAARKLIARNKLPTSLQNSGAMR